MRIGENVEKKDNVIKRFKKFILSKKSKLKRYMKWYKIYDNKKYFTIKQKILNILLILAIFIITIVSLFLFFYALNYFKIYNIF